MSRQLKDSKQPSNSHSPLKSSQNETDMVVNPQGWYAFEPIRDLLAIRIPLLAEAMKKAG